MADDDATTQELERFAIAMQNEADRFLDWNDDRQELYDIVASVAMRRVIERRNANG